MGLFLEEKVEEAIRLLKLHEPPEGYYLAFSGGKDSTVIYDLAKRAGVKFQAYYNITTVDPPELLEHIKTYYPDTIWERPQYNMLQLIKKNGLLPTRFMRYCCRYLKESHGNGRFVVDGVRRQESVNRSYREKLDYDPAKEKKILHVIVDWTEHDVWEYIKLNNLPYCKLYDEGYKRIGCIACPFKSGNERRKDFERYPYLLKAYKRVLEKVFHKTLAKHFKNVDEYIEWWLSDLSISEWKNKFIVLRIRS